MGRAICTAGGASGLIGLSAGLALLFIAISVDNVIGEILEFLASGCIEVQVWLVTKLPAGEG
jgi:hypothetical protein